MVTPVDYLPDAPVELCLDGITTALIDAGPAEAIDAFALPESVFDLALIARIGPATEPGHVREARGRGVRVFDVDAADPTPELLDELSHCTVRIPAHGEQLSAWAEACAGCPVLVVVSHVTPKSLGRAGRAKSVNGAEVCLEVSTDVLWCRPESIWEAIADRTIDLVAHHTPRGPGPFTLLMAEAQTRRALTMERIAELLAGGPARAARIDDRKGILRRSMDADVVVLDAHTPKAASGPPERGRVNLVLRRGAFLFLHEEVHAAPTSGVVLSSPLKGSF
ncbi:hypothetical protein ACIHCX_16505 [Streptomyces sp. NPDC052043]|uniref:hypothetical protein n=1 Tax=Streptomyces sp. NPDC052043 TaxID=3365684 RepID=UPI0037D62F03